MHTRPDLNIDPTALSIDEIWYIKRMMSATQSYEKKFDRNVKHNLILSTLKYGHDAGNYKDVLSLPFTRYYIYIRRQIFCVLVHKSSNDTNYIKLKGKLTINIIMP